MASLRPEGALNISKGLVEIGRVDDALDALHQVLSNRRYRQWNATMEKIAEEYVKLCLVLGKHRYAKDGLIQYRNICQPNNLQSLDGIMKQFRSLAEEKVRQTRGKLTTGADGLVDLDETESGESLLLSALSAGSAVADERAARSALRDLWDALRTILEVCRNQPALDETYHATAVMAFEFCRYVIFHDFRDQHQVHASTLLTLFVGQRGSIAERKLITNHTI
jgi:translation initiation factor 3 subunit A